MYAVRVLADGGFDDQIAGVGNGYGEGDQVGVGHVTDGGSEGLQHLGGVGAGQQTAGQFTAGHQPAFAAVHGAVEPGIVDRHPGRGGQGAQHRLVIGVEGGPTVLVGQIQVAEHLRTHPDGGTEESPHRRMTRREADGVHVLVEVHQPQCVRLADQQPQDALAFRSVPKIGDGLLVHADRDELLESALLAEHTQRPVLGVDQVGRRLHDLPQHDTQVEVAANGQDRLQQRMHPVPGGANPPDLRLQIFQQFVKVHLRRRCSGALRGRVVVHTDSLRQAASGSSRMPPTVPPGAHHAHQLRTNVHLIGGPSAPSAPAPSAPTT